jgi:hypothetical protein
MPPTLLHIQTAASARTEEAHSDRDSLASDGTLLWDYRVGYLAKLVLAILVTVAGFSAQALAEKRIALVIGNSTYRNVARLDNPSNDAKLMADTLRGRGFVLVGDSAQFDLDKAPTIAQILAIALNWPIWPPRDLGSSKP